MRAVRRLFASFLALWVVLATTGVDATVYFCAGMGEVSQHPCCADDEEPAGPRIEELGHHGCCAVASLEQDERATAAPDAPAVSFVATPVLVVALPQHVPAPLARFTYARGPPGGPPLFIEHRALLI